MDDYGINKCTVIFPNGVGLVITYNSRCDYGKCSDSDKIYNLHTIEHNAPIKRAKNACSKDRKFILSEIDFTRGNKIPIKDVLFALSTANYYSKISQAK
jgi:hypothetical protein